MIDAREIVIRRRLSLWIAGMAFSRTNTRRALAAWEEGVAVVREHRVHFFEGFLARDAARLHTTDGEPDIALGLCAPDRTLTDDEAARMKSVLLEDARVHFSAEVRA